MTDRDNGEDELLVSVVTPAYNEEEYIEETLQSVKIQDYDHVEHIVIDDGSTDMTPEILSWYEDEYNIRWISKENEGQAQAVNDGFELANGDIVVWLNADDVLFTEDTLSKVVSAFKENPSVSVLYGNLAKIDHKTQLNWITVPIPWFSYNRLKRWYFSQFVFMRKEITEECHLDPEYQYVLDYEYHLRVAAKEYKFKYLNATLYGFRQHEDSKSEQGAEQMATESEKCRRKFNQEFDTQYKINRLIDKILFIGLQVYAIILYSYYKYIGEDTTDVIGD